ncbi:MAG TPA: cytochrome c nitrite reductase small subunit [Verrucomicrobiota bacterium]|nr:cytochrome c nitrite reductase small subunit [Verrucomicrobiota bacterium]
MKRTTIAGILVGAMMGLALGVCAYTFVYAKGASYLTNDPRACVNCHVMQDQYDGWIKSSHRSVATCNDCHAPHDLIGKYSTKAQNGFWHSFYFTTGNYPDNIRINERNRKITDDACRKCHADITETIEGPPSAHHSNLDKTSCIRCHRNVGHMH